MDRSDTLRVIQEGSRPSTFDFTVSRHRLHLFELADQRFIPGFLRRRVQTILSGQWTHRIPLLQKLSPAELAASKLLEILDLVIAASDSAITLIDFCSGGGGPTPYIERTINAQRLERGLAPVHFLLTDIHPHISDWMKASETSDYLGFIPQPVDAANPPVSVISQNAPQNDANAEFSSDRRVFRLFFLSFHHFNDKQACEILASSMETADGFAIFELQDRRISSLILIFLEPIFIFLVAIFWFIMDPWLLIFTYIVPLLPPIMAFDGFVSCLRTRTFEEILQLVDRAMKDRALSSQTLVNGNSTPSQPADGELWLAERGHWRFEGGRVTHTFPLGHMSWFIGWRHPQERVEPDLIEM